MLMERYTAAFPAEIDSLIFNFFFKRKVPYMPVSLANDSNTSRQIKDTSRTARPAPGEAASPWQTIYMVQHDTLPHACIIYA